MVLPPVQDDAVTWQQKVLFKAGAVVGVVWVDEWSDKGKKKQKKQRLAWTR